MATAQTLADAAAVYLINAISDETVRLPSVAPAASRPRLLPRSRASRAASFSERGSVVDDLVAEAQRRFDASDGPLREPKGFSVSVACR